MSVHVPMKQRQTALPGGLAFSSVQARGWRPPIYAVSLALFFLGLGVLAQAYIVEANTPAAYGWFWAGLGLCMGGALITGIAPAGTTWQRVLMLALLGGALYAPTFLRSPAYPIFADELYHYQALTLMREQGTREVNLTFFTVPRDYPGLALLGLHIVSSAGLPSEWAVRLVPLIVHLTMPVLAYAALAALRVPERLAFVGGLLYMSNRSFFFFHSVFSYETLGTLLFLVVALLSLNLLRQETPSAWPFHLLLLPVIAAISITHHFSTLISLAWLLICALVTWSVGHKQRRLFGGLLFFAALFGLAWLAFQSDRGIQYVVLTITNRTVAFFNGVQAALSASAASPGSDAWRLRPLFANSPLPLAERIVAYLYPALIAALIAAGPARAARFFWVRRGQDLTPYAGILVLGIFGPVLWLLSTPLVLTVNQDAAYRSWPFLFLGVALYAIIALYGVETETRRPRAPKSLAAFGIAIPLLIGGIVLGDNQAGRFHTHQIFAASGPEAITDDLVAAARWLEAHYGPHHRVAGDRASQVAFGAFGNQRTRIWGVGHLYYYDDPGGAIWFLNEHKIDFVSVDRRVSRYLPRYSTYFGDADPFGQQRPTQPVPVERLEKFDRIRDLQRVYDNGDIILYRKAVTR
ncbi:MAG: hypothetical protein RMK84_02785 [Oscillochloridaceae bacterium]|nr:hypothetical protein [Chloroflexaceae bacterium]MDW8389027.1 hypothetical protein [Oscillochloridaceae bacterium]